MRRSGIGQMGEIQVVGGCLPHQLGEGGVDSKPMPAPVSHGNLSGHKTRIPGPEPKVPDHKPVFSEHEKPVHLFGKMVGMPEFIYEFWASSLGTEISRGAPQHLEFRKPKWSEVE
jgi:hypothetical protein